jgi:ribonuclease III
MAEDQSEALSLLEQRIGYVFKNRELLNCALTHRSHVQECKDTSNERMEFVGDALLGAVISRYLYDHFSEWAEGQLTKAKAALVSETALTAAARRLQLGEALFLSKGEEQGGGRQRSSILCGAFEALVAAIYMDGGLDIMRSFIFTWLAEPLKGVALDSFNKDYKTLLQEVLQEAHHTLPVYRVVKETGPDHDKTFVVEVCLGKQMLGIGAGKSKKEAAQSAAKQALEKRDSEQN